MDATTDLEAQPMDRGCRLPRAGALTGNQQSVPIVTLQEVNAGWGGRGKRMAYTLFQIHDKNPHRFGSLLAFFPRPMRRSMDSPECPKLPVYRFKKALVLENESNRLIQSAEQGHFACWWQNC